MEGQGSHEGFTFKLHCRSRSLGLRRAPQMASPRDWCVVQKSSDCAKSKSLKKNNWPMRAYELWDVNVINHSSIILTFRNTSLSHTPTSRNQKCFCCYIVSISVPSHWPRFTEFHRTSSKGVGKRDVIVPIGKDLQGNLLFAGWPSARYLLLTSFDHGIFSCFDTL